MVASSEDQIEVVKVLMETRADPFLRNKDVINFQFFHLFHVCKIKQQEIWPENGIIIMLKDFWRNMREILKD